MTSVKDKVLGWADDEQPKPATPDNASQSETETETEVPSSTDATLGERVVFEHCKRTVTKWWPAYWPYVESILSLAATLRMKDVPASIAVFAMGSSGVGKNTIFKMFDWQLERLIIWRDKFTLAAIQSHYQGEDAKTLNERALFNRAKHKLLITPEMALLFRGKHDELRTRFSDLAQMLDGEGRIGDSGTHGPLGQKGDYTMVWVGGTTPFYIDTWNTMAALGTRLLFFAVSKAEYVDDELYAQALKECKEAVSGFLDVLIPDGSVRQDEWPRMDDAFKKTIHDYSTLMALGHARRENVANRSQEVEFPAANHFRSRLGHLVRGRAIVYGRREVVAEDLEMARWITASSMPQKRGPVMLALYEGVGQIGDIARQTGLTVTTVTTTIKELERLGVVEEIDVSDDSMVVGRGRPATQYRISVERFEECA